MNLILSNVIYAFGDKRSWPDENDLDELIRFVMPKTDTIGIDKLEIDADGFKDKEHAFQAGRIEAQIIAMLARDDGSSGDELAKVGFDFVDCFKDDFREGAGHELSEFLERCQWQHIEIKKVGE